MALADVVLIEYPRCGWYANVGSSDYLLDANGEKCAFIVQAPATGSIRKVGFFTTTVTTGDTMDVRIETVNATNGQPTGTLWGTNTNVAHTINAADDNTWHTTAALTADASVTKGDVLAVVIVNSTTGNLIISGMGGWGISQFPYIAHYTASWALSTGGGARVVLEYSDGTVPRIIGSEPMSAVGSDNSTSSTLYRGCEITLPCAVRATGLWGYLYAGAATGTHTYKLFDSDGTTALATITWDVDRELNASVYPKRLQFSSPVTLKANTKYWLAGTSDGTRNLRVYYYTFASTTIRDAFSHGGSGVSWSQATSPTGTGDWTNTATRIPMMGLLIDQIDFGSGPLVGPGRLIRN